MSHRGLALTQYLNF